MFILSRHTIHFQCSCKNKITPANNRVEHGILYHEDFLSQYCASKTKLVSYNYFYFISFQAWKLLKISEAYVYLSKIRDVLCLIISVKFVNCIEGQTNKWKETSNVIRSFLGWGRFWKMAGIGEGQTHSKYVSAVNVVLMKTFLSNVLN